MARALRAWAINRRGKNLVRNLQYGPRTRLVKRYLYHKSSYYISKLARALRLVNLAGRTLLHGLPKWNLKLILLPNCCVIYRQNFLNYLASKGLKLSFTLNRVLKRTNDLKTISNWLLLLSTCFRNLKPFLVDRNRSGELVRHTIKKI